MQLTAEHIIRSLAKHRFYSFINVIGLAIGIAELSNLSGLHEIIL